MWKQDLGQWVERKGRRGWLKQQPIQQQSQQPAASVRPAAHVGFVPEGFEDRYEAATAIPDIASPGVIPRDTRESPSYEGQRWIAIYGASAGSIMDVREYLDVMFGRTVEHRCPAELREAPNSQPLVISGSQNWFYVKFEDPVAAARAVHQSPLTIPIASSYSITAVRAESAARGAVAAAAAGRRGNGLPGEETVGVAWCTDEAFLQEDAREERELHQRRMFTGGTTGSSNSSPMKGAQGIQNTSGAMPYGADRLQHTPAPAAQSEVGSARASRGLGSVLRDALASPWSARWTAAPSTGDASPPSAAATRIGTSAGGGSSSSPARTEVFHDNDGSPSGNGRQPDRGSCEAPNGQCHKDAAATAVGNVVVPSFLLSRGHHHFHHKNAARHVNSGIPVRPLSGNASVLSVFRADASQRGLLQRALLAIKHLPARVSCLLASSSLHGAQLEEAAAADDDSTWRSVFGGYSLDRRYERQQYMLRRRHYNTATRFRSANGGYGEEAALASWGPSRWYESSTVLSLLVLFTLLVLVSGLSGSNSTSITKMDVKDTDRWGSGAAAGPVTSTETQSGEKTGVPRGPVGQLQGTIFAD
ncbi:hypothetical protein DQ04_04081010 [Trypanosoma grayi]|uniref:hypothetical protein n=1 Tax=Trypanosoma grayi TaxID=71804 RepID=UPI0004F497A4|nr:hypothetical protein DQ04_04081010 [Trypanosoma grayi]KEG10176.1 hypothetical protein DQ04_04081010 [Trypanosoma grayi]